ncbi:phage tail protein [Allosphingosinicella flava]|uniref:Phage tail protein n=1 Tax=Allosphingosinicella flava TaxID=2771430 RepID=A0A7T2GLI3_9SPHN|nr:phage tail protein [Sphingosinicella flava]QPQ56071.1 phage tail protein [Sphingosinicella flava]
MATLVFTAVGTAIGGPIGGMIGSIIGQQVDNALFAPKGRQGPRLGDLAIQTSSYGTAIPKIFGTLRAAGTVIWATDIKESKSTSGGGKGRPKTTAYSYSASFAVALSGRPIRTVRRIWADGKLLRGAAGDFKSKTKFRLHTGGEDQAVDPLIASREGLGATPAFRGMAYAVFEDLQLADYGNRIPSLTFEIVADDGPVPAGGIAEGLSDAIAAPVATPAFGGYAASGNSVGGALEPLFAVMPLSLSEMEGALLLKPRPEMPIEIDADLTQATSGGKGGRSETNRRAATLTPDDVTIAYHEPVRDYQTGLQRASRGSGGLNRENIAIPASLSAAEAKGFAEYRLKSVWAGRETAKVHLSWRDLDLRPGEALTAAELGGLWKIDRLTLEHMVVSLDLVRIPGGLPQPIAATPGRSSEQTDAVHGETVLVLADLPLGEESVRNKPLLLAAAAGTSPGWRQAELIVSYDGGTSWEAGGMTAGPAIMGRILAPLGPSGSALLDLTNTIEVELLHDDMWLESCDDDALAAGANLALIGRELIQFGEAEPLGGNRFRLSRLLRGRRGSEWAASHEPGAPFVLIERDNLASFEPEVSRIGLSARLIAQGIGDAAEGVETACLVTGEALRPPCPVHLQARKQEDGAVHIAWARRSRQGWSWLDGGDTPLVEEREHYMLRIFGTGFSRIVETAAPQHLYSASERAADGNPDRITLEVAQIGTFHGSRPATLTIDL